MAKARAILKRIGAVRNIAKITNTMQMIATARFKRAFDRAVAARPYTDRLGKLIEELTVAAGDYSHPLLQTRDAKRVAVLAIASNRGLCGGYNSHVSRSLARLREELARREVEVELHVSGKKLISGLRFQGVAMASTISHIDDKVRFDEVDEVASPLIERFQSGELDELHVVYTKFLTSARQQACAEQVLPLTPEAVAGDEDARSKPPWGRQTIFSPDPQTILDDLLPRSVRLHVFQAFLDAAVSEQTARRMAMKVATDNAHDVVVELTRTYNRSRQAQITTELSEIMGGAAALE
jgi:F-type H+-transporting ATPase subunit gamma